MPGCPSTCSTSATRRSHRALHLIREEYGRRVSKGRMTGDEVGHRMALIHGTVDYGDFADVDVVIEAVFEVMTLKKEVMGKLDAVCKAGAVIASNTSTLDVAEIASATGRAADVVGMHFFSPAQVMRLLEIVRTDVSADGVLATSMALAKKLGKVGVLSGNSYGFIGNRMMEPYGREAERMLLEGTSPRRIDKVLKRFGMAMGILAVYDMAGVDVGYKVQAGTQGSPAGRPGLLPRLLDARGTWHVRAEDWRRFLPLREGLAGAARQSGSARDCSPKKHSASE